MKEQIKQAIKRLFKVGEDMQVTATFTVKSGGTFNPATGKAGGQTTAIHIVKAYSTGYRQKDIDGSLIKTTDRKLIIEKAECPFTPKTVDKVSVDGVGYTIVDVKEVAQVCFALQIRN